VGRSPDHPTSVIEGLRAVGRSPDRPTSSTEGLRVRASVAPQGWHVQETVPQQAPFVAR